MAHGLIVERLPAARIHDAVAVLCEAFQDDPIFGHYFPDLAVRLRVFELVFANLIETNRRFRSVFAAFDGRELIGAAIWRAPQATTNLFDRVREGIMQARIRGISRGASDDLAEGFRLLEELHPREPHWYLAFVGVRRSRQGRGVGLELLQPVLDAAAVNGRHCYLETPFLQTHAFYRALGFEVIEECSPFLGAPQVWRMLRRAHA